MSVGCFAFGFRGTALVVCANWAAASRAIDAISGILWSLRSCLYRYRHWTSHLFPMSPLIFDQAVSP
jgi:hypothetical protein